MADLEEALRKLPHGPEFRFVDRLLSLVPGKEGVGQYRVRGDEFFLRGHLPSEPLLPGVILVEAAAQLAGVVAQNDPEIPPLPGLKLTGLRAVKILGTARPGETVLLKAHVTGRLGSLVQAEASASVAGKKILSAEVTLSGTGANPDALPARVRRAPARSGNENRVEAKRRRKGAGEWPSLSG